MMLQRNLWLSLLIGAVLLAACAAPGGMPIVTDPLPATTTPAPRDNPDQPVTHATPSSGNIAPTPEYAPRPGDEELTHGQVFIEASDALLLESFPVQVRLILKGSLPTPCHQLRVKVDPPDADGRIHVEAYSVAEPGQVCVQVLSPFSAQVDLGTYASGTYSVWVNGKQIGEFSI